MTTQLYSSLIFNSPAQINLKFCITFSGETSSGYDTGSTFNHQTNQHDFDNWDDYEAEQKPQAGINNQTKPSAATNVNTYKDPKVDEACNELMEIIEDKYYCLKCPNSRGFVRKRDLFIHIREKHLQLPRHQCTECGRTYAQKDGLDNHMILMHSVVLKHKSMDSRPSAAILHVGKHFKCTLCTHSRKYSSKSGIAYHIKLNHYGKRHTCAECGKSFVDRGKLEVHLKRKRHSMANGRFSNVVAKLTHKPANEAVKEEENEFWRSMSDGPTQHATENEYFNNHNAAEPAPFTIAAVYSAQDLASGGVMLPESHLISSDEDNDEEAEEILGNGLEPECNIEMENNEEDQTEYVI